MKTIEKAAKESSDNLRIYSSKSDFEKGFKLGVEFAQRWIQVEEGLPELTDDKLQVRVLIKSKSGRIYLSYFDAWKGWHSNANIDYWRPIDLK